MSTDASSLKAVLFALGANFGIFLAKSAAAFFTGSSAMLAEAVHSFADCGNQLLLLRGMREAKRPPDANHPMGYGMVVYFWSFLVAVLLFTVGGLFSIYEGAHKIGSTEPVAFPLAAIAVLSVSVVLESISLWGCLREIRKSAGGRSLWRYFRTSRDSDLIVVMGEDVAALAGLVIALLAVVMSVVTGHAAFDAAGSIAVGVLLILVAVLLSVQIKGLITGQSADAAMESRKRAQLQARAEVAELYSLLTLQMGPDVMVAIKARMRETSDAQKLIDDVNRVEASLRTEFPRIRWLFFEPDDRP
jgi:cation diffusion facilitator family transporter